MSKILVTGGAGFIGSHVVEHYLNKGCEVTVIDNLSTGRIENLDQSNENLNFLEYDIRNPFPRKILSNIKSVIHLAALADIVPSIENPKSYYESNVQGTFNLLEECRRSKIKKFIYAASSSCYGLAKTLPTCEESPIEPQYPYALTKRMGEELVVHWEKVYNLPAISLRFFNVYGPRSRTSGTYGAVFGVFLAQKLAKKPFTVVGDGNQTRDFTFVSDIVRAIDSAANSSLSGKIYNVGSGKSISVNRIAELLGGSKTFIPKRPGEPDCTFADISKIKKELKWNPKFSIEEGIKILLENIDYWKDAPVWNEKSISAATKDWFKYLGD
jgi:UDP-glucose 4-epimerase